MEYTRRPKFDVAKGIGVAALDYYRNYQGEMNGNYRY